MRDFFKDLFSEFSITQSHVWLVGIILLLVLCLSPFTAFAASSAGTGMPWEAPLNVFVNSLTGPVALGIAVAGFFVAGAILAFGGDLNGFVRTLLILIMVAAVLVGARSLVSMFFGAGAEITATTRMF